MCVLLISHPTPPQDNQVQHVYRHADYTETYRNHLHSINLRKDGWKTVKNHQKRSKTFKTTIKNHQNKKKHWENYVPRLGARGPVSTTGQEGSRLLLGGQGQVKIFQVLGGWGLTVMALGQKDATQTGTTGGGRVYFSFYQ